MSRKRRLGRRPLTTEQILAWADAFYERHGRWPRQSDGAITGTQGAQWMAVNAALRLGLRGLPGNSSLAQLLAEHRGHRNRKRLPQLTEEQILAWADEHHERTGHFPTVEDGALPDTHGEVWINIDACLKEGHRGLPGGSSLARLLDAERGVRNKQNLPRLSKAQILRWADEHHERTGEWPKSHTGIVIAAPGESWSSINSALIAGCRGLPAGSSLARLLQAKRGVPNHLAMPPLTPELILAWADAQYRRTGDWPKVQSGLIHGARPPQTWRAVEAALRAGCRGLPGGSTLKRFLRAHGRGT
jgi:hypothetical protein